MKRWMIGLAVLVTVVAAQTASAAGPGYEPAYVNGMTVMINAIEVTQQRAPAQAQADLYEVVYPINWQSLGLQPPQCNPCDHQNNGIDFTDFHDHILDSAPGVGSGYRPLWHVWVIVPAYNQNASHDAAVSSQYATYLPAKSEQEVQTLLDARMPDGSPLAAQVDTHFYFICAVVNPNAAK